MVSNPIYSGDIYEELPEDSVHPLHVNGASAVPASLSLPPSIPPPRKTDNTEELSQSEREAVEAKLRDMGGAGPESEDAKSQVSSCCGEETEDCYTVMSPAGTLTVLPRNRHSAASITTSWPMAGTL